MRRRASPVLGAIEVIRRAETDDRDVTTSRTEVTVSPDEPVFPGHYPDFPIFPGVCEVEYVHLSALLTAPDGPVELVALDSARFTGPVHPGDRIDIEMRWTTTDGVVVCSASVRGPRGECANVRLRYRPAPESKN
ncbi:3-hydroxyacyl-ACP dehydratase FabZ family protein [Virgisporangium ochraceum]|uniref:3-hydroxyacyl-ACP dehydratase FabZ family protein n=1 Tax=Virgisporangium ochraceum TaxID=65505 RepID=UPI001943F690|nr:hypothetical protein [Virgisporangium ochraceum]